MRRAVGSSIVGRDDEMAVLHASLACSGGPSALVLTGGPGIGKTTLWDAAIDIARAHGTRVLLARPSGAEAQLAYAALIDLLDGVPTEELDLPFPQRRALEVAILRAAPAAAVEPRAIAVGFVGALRALSRREELVVAIDDIQWLDAPSSDVLTYAARRLEDEGVRFLMAKRPVGSSSLERSLERRGIEQLEVGPLSLGATRRLLSERLGLSLPRKLLRRIVDATLGNPLFALEIGRTLAERGPLEYDAEVPLPDAVEDLLGTRVGRLRRPVRRSLLAVALSADLRASELAAIVGWSAVEGSVESGVLLIDGDRVRASHPLLAAAARKRSRASERRELHRELAGVVADEELRALNLALATEQPDEQLAAGIAAAAAGAAARGSAQQAVALAEHALRLTQSAQAERTDRRLALAGYLETAGEPRRVTALLEPELESLPPGAARVRAQLLLSEGGSIRTMADHVRHLDQALAESQDDTGLRALVLAKIAGNTAPSCVERIPEAEAWALEALSNAHGAGDEVEVLALYALAWARSLRGCPIDDLCARFHAAYAGVHMVYSPEPAAGNRLAWRGEITAARAAFRLQLSRADERGEEMAYALLRLFLCELELRAGEWAAAERLLDEWSKSPDLLVPETLKRCRAQLAAGRGLAEDAERWGEPALAGAEAFGARWQVLESLRALGTAALLAHEPARAAERLGAVWQHTAREGVEDPGAFPVAPDLVEALVELGNLDEARDVSDRLATLAQEQDHPWGLVTASRCNALIRLAASRYDEQAAATLARTAADYGELGLRFDRARVLLSLGRAQRRRRKWKAARESLERAGSAFDELGSPGWAEAARSELARVGARRPRAEGELTEAERRVVELAIEGKSNKEIAHHLVVTVPTVERHLSRAYAKLGVRSRGQLAGRLSADAHG